MSNIFSTPDISTLIISSTLNAEMDFPADIQSFTFQLGLIDCNGDLNGGAFIDNCDNCAKQYIFKIPKKYQILKFQN